MRIKPLTTQALRNLIIERLVHDGHKCDLNDIDISAVSDFSQLFKNRDFTSDISRWDVSHATNMHAMFAQSTFTGNISKWNVSSVRNMSDMFERSQFNSDISAWNVSSVGTMANMFRRSDFNGDINAWDVSKVEYFEHMFYDSGYAGNLSMWQPIRAKSMECMFWGSEYTGTLSTWRPPEDCNTEYVINPMKMVSSKTPSFYHFKLMYSEAAAFNTEWAEFANQHRSILDGMGMTAMQAGLWLHQQWKNGPAVDSDLRIPTGAFDDLVQR